MADITFHTANRYEGDTTWLAQYYGAQTTTNFEVLDSSGVLRDAFYGTAFTYRSSGFFNSGTVNSINTFSSDGTLTTSKTGLNVDVSTRNNLLTVGTSGYKYQQYELRGNDRITGSSGNDKIIGSKGNDVIDGGAGVDVLSFKGFDVSVNVNLSTGTVTNSYGTSSVDEVEDIEGSGYGDALTGNALNNSFQGFGGNDTISGGSGIDTVSFLDATSAVTVNLSSGTATGGSGSDTLSSIERVIGSRFNDTLTGSSANESFVGGFGNDSINGSSGVDTVEYSGVGSGITVNLTTGVTSGGAGADILVSIENVKGSIFADSITGNSVANNLRGGNGNDALVGASGNDSLYGEAGNDILRGGNGNDILYGGAGRDIFRFDSTLGTTTTPNIDQIKDFSVVDDTIQLQNAIFNNAALTAVATNTALSSTTTLSGYFKAITTGGVTDSKDYIVYNKTTGGLYYDADGGTDGNADGIQIALLGTNLALTAADFVIV